MRRKWAIVAAVLILAGAAIAGSVVFYRGWENRIRRSVLACSDSQVTDMVVEAFDQSEFARFSRSHAAQIDGIHETGFLYSPPKRQCAAQILATDYSRPNIAYTVENAPDNQFTVRLSFPKVPEDPVPAKPE